jgi:signal transduction histidine kinase
MSRLRTLARRYGIDVLIVIAAFESALEVLLRQDNPRAPSTTPWLAAAILAAVILLLLGRHRYPFGAPAVFWIAGGVLSFVDGQLLVFTSGAYVAGLAAAVMLGSVRNARQERLGLLIVLAAAEAIAYNDPTRSSGELAFIPLVFAIGWLLGFALRERGQQAEVAEERAAEAERERESVARLAVAEERARIARELHDVVAHAMSVMVLQVGAVRHRLPGELEQDRDALRDVERAGRTALIEMRRLLGAMRSDDDDLELAPQAGLGSLEPLLDEVRRAGLAVDLHVEGEPYTLPAALDLSAYRIVQEGLTNALKHARADRAEVTVRYAPGEVRIEVHDDGRGPASTGALGHGLVGIRERVTIFGGEMTAGSANGGGFTLSTRLPVKAAT